MSGGDGADTLTGGAGADTIVGDNGADTFRFDFVNDGLDSISGFSVADDTIQFDNASFAAIGPDGTLAANAFVIGTAAGDGDDRVIYDSTTGALYYDSDGNGATAAIQIATLGTGLALTNNDFVII